MRGAEIALSEDGRREMDLDHPEQRVVRVGEPPG